GVTGFDARPPRSVAGRPGSIANRTRRPTLRRLYYRWRRNPARRPRVHPNVVAQRRSKGERPMALLDLVEFTDPTGHTLVARVPPNGDGELRLGSQCIVREGQLAFLARDGRFLDMLAPGRHTLSTNNIPLLIEFIKPVFQGGRSPFRADVYFVSLHQHTDLKWGTPQPIPMRDAQFGMVRLRAFGTFIVQVAEPRRLLSTVVGTRGRFTVQDLEDQLRSSIIARVADVIAEWMREKQLSVVDLATQYDEISVRAHAALKDDFAHLGMELTRFYINTISMPEELERKLDQV